MSASHWPNADTPSPRLLAGDAVDHPGRADDGLCLSLGSLHLLALLDAHNHRWSTSSSPYSRYVEKGELSWCVVSISFLLYPRDISISRSSNILWSLSPFKGDIKVNRTSSNNDAKSQNGNWERQDFSTHFSWHPVRIYFKLSTFKNSYENLLYLKKNQKKINCSSAQNP